MIRIDWRNQNPTLIKEFANCPSLCRLYSWSLALAQTWPQSCFLQNSNGQTESVVSKLHLATKSISLSFPKLHPQAPGAKSCPLSQETMLRTSCFESVQIPPSWRPIQASPSMNSQALGTTISFLAFPSLLAPFGPGLWAVYLRTDWEISWDAVPRTTLRPFKVLPEVSTLPDQGSKFSMIKIKERLSELPVLFQVHVQTSATIYHWTLLKGNILKGNVVKKTWGVSIGI